MNLANKLTFLRIITSFVFMIVLFFDGVFPRILALLLFSFAVLTDFLDGKAARQYKTITNLGKLLDPLADKILIAVAFISFVEMGIISSWMVVLIISREFCVTGLRLIASSKGNVISASKAGKHKTISQMVVIILILLLLIARSLLIKFGVTVEFLEVYDYWTDFVVLISMMVTISLTLISGYIYINENLGLFEE